MHYNRRIDAKEIADELKRFRSKVPKGVRDLASFAFHYTDVRNASSILNDGVLYSRDLALNHGSMIHDNANARIIAQSATSGKFVRLYFRPATPTQYVNEGIKPEALVESGHCPVPVFFAFDLEQVLCREGTTFTSEGANRAQGFLNFEGHRPLRLLPVTKIYSLGPPPDDETKAARHAEILVPDSLPLQPYARWIICRSQAERETLLTGLKYKPRVRWESKIVVPRREAFFVRRWPFVTRVHIGADRRTINFEMFRAIGRHTGPLRYQARCVIRDLGTSRSISLDKSYDAHVSDQISFETQGLPDHFRLTLRIDGSLAFEGLRSARSIFDPEDLPF